MNKPIDISNVILKTERLILRPWKETDLNDFYEYAKVDGVGQMAGWLPHKNIEESQLILSAFIRKKRTFAIEFDGKVIGCLDIKTYGEKSYPELEKLQGREFGYVLSKDYWGQGIMPEAVKAVTEYLFSVENLDFILCGCFVENKQSARVIEKCGFKYYKTIEFTTSYGEKRVADDSILYNPREGAKIMEIKKMQEYNQQMNIKFDYLEKITVKDIVDTNTDKWFNQTLCQVNSSVLRLGIFEGEYHMHKHEEDDEVFFMLEGEIILETEKGNFELKQYEGVCVPKGVMHRPVVPSGKAVVLMIENKGIDPIGTV